MYRDETACWMESETQCTPPKKPRPCKQTQPQPHPDVQIIHRLFWNCLLWHKDASNITLPSPHWDSREIHRKRFWWDVSTGDKSTRRREGTEKILWKTAMGVYYKGQRESKPGRVVFERDELGSDRVLSRRPTVIQAIPDSMINVFLRKKTKKMNNSSLPNDRHVRHVKHQPHATPSLCDSSHDKFITFSWCPWATCPIHLKALQALQRRKYTCQTEGMWQEGIT